LGEELYNKLSEKVGECVTGDLYDELWQIYKKMDARSTEKLKEHEIILSQFLKNEAPLMDQ